jgi:hypothetical protein
MLILVVWALSLDTVSRLGHYSFLHVIFRQMRHYLPLRLDFAQVQEIRFVARRMLATKKKLRPFRPSRFFFFSRLGLTILGQAEMQKNASFFVNLSIFHLPRLHHANTQIYNHFLKPTYATAVAASQGKKYFLFATRTSSWIHRLSQSTSSLYHRLPCRMQSTMASGTRPSWSKTPQHHAPCRRSLPHTHVPCCQSPQIPRLVPQVCDPSTLPSSHDRGLSKASTTFKAWLVPMKRYGRTSR